MENQQHCQEHAASIEIIVTAGIGGWYGQVSVDGRFEYGFGPELTLAQARARADKWLRERALVDELVRAALAREELRTAGERPAFRDGQTLEACRECLNELARCRCAGRAKAVR